MVMATGLAVISKRSTRVDTDGYADNPLDDDGDASVSPVTVWYIDADFDGYGSDSVTRVV